MGRIKVHDGRWTAPGYLSGISKWEAHARPDSYWDDGYRLDAEGRLALGYFCWTVIGLWIAGTVAYICLTDYTWTTVAVVAGVVTGVPVLYSLFTVGILRTGERVLRFALWAFLLVVMSAAFGWLWSVQVEKLTSGLSLVALLVMAVAWLYGAAWLFRLAFRRRGY